MQSTSLSPASRNLGCSHPRFSSRRSLVMVGKNCIASKNGPSCSTMRWIVALPISILVDNKGLRLRVKAPWDRVESLSRATLSIAHDLVGKPVLTDHILAIASCQVGMLQPAGQIGL